MILDERTEIADAVSIAAGTGTALIGDVIDLTVARDVGQGQPVYLVIQVTETFSGTSTTVNFRVRSDGVVAIHATTSTAHVETGLIAEAVLVLGHRIVLALPGAGNAYERYLGVQAIISVATLDNGSVNIFLTTEPSVLPTTSYADAAN